MVKERMTGNSSTSIPPGVKELKKSVERLEALMDEIPIAVVNVDTKGKITYVNKDVLRRTGYLREDLVGKNGFRLGLFPRETYKVLGRRMKEKLMGKPPSPLEMQFKRKDGTWMWIETRGRTLWEHGVPIGVQIVAQDITERKQAEEELREAQERLVRSEKLAAIGQLAGGVGHELRNPLGAIKNAVYYVKGKVAKSELAQEEPRLMEFLDIMDEEINASNKIINDLLGFSHVGKPSVSPTRIEKVIEDTLSRIAIPENIELTKKLDGDLPEVNIDPDQIKQVLVNIITNAAQAMPEGGKLTIGAREKDKFLEVEVADTGCGIPEESVDKIFDPLFTTRAKGIGLGLAVCKSIIDRHEGNIAVKSKVGKGTTINIELPLTRE